MDGIKDINPKDTLSRVLSDTSIRTTAFGSNIAGERAYRKAERIVAGIFLVTRHVRYDEPVRIDARRASLGLLSDILALREEMRSSESQTLVVAQSAVRKLISLVRVLSVAGHLSFQNAETLIEALDDLGVFLVSSQKTPYAEHVALTPENFSDMNIGAASTRAKNFERIRVREGIKDTQEKITRERVSNKNGRAQKRTEQVVNVLSTNGKLGIKDIVAHLPEYSEKMVQRELRHLIMLGRVKKSGSKRWSIYSLAQQ